MLKKYLLILLLPALANSAFAGYDISANARARSFGKLTACRMAKENAENKMANLCERNNEQLKYVQHSSCSCSKDSRTKRFDCEVRSRGLCE